MRSNGLVAYAEQLGARVTLRLHVGANSRFSGINGNWRKRSRRHGEQFNVDSDLRHVSKKMNKYCDRGIVVWFILVADVIWELQKKL